jgi:hypothetical protein
VKNEQLVGEGGTQAQVPKKEALFLLNGSVTFFQNKKEWRNDGISLHYCDK